MMICHTESSQSNGHGLGLVHIADAIADLFASGLVKEVDEEASEEAKAPQREGEQT